MLYKFISNIVKIIPKPLIRKCNLYRFANLVLSKEEEGLVFWELFTKIFQQDKHKLLEYWVKYRYLYKIQEICDIRDDSKVLDVGCGVCTILHYIKGKRFGIDPLADKLVKIYKYPEDINITKGYGENIPFPDNYFDTIFCSNALDHTEDPNNVVAEIYRVLKPQGYFILTIEIFQEHKKRDIVHPHTFQKEDVYSLIKDKYEVLFENESPWIGLKAYYAGLRRSHKKELIMVLRKEINGK